ncbi:xylulokinase [Blautia producta]|uniref:xylulokinase n=1 Tax=Blautia producta TaxID=33035 RepID=UPI001D036395|nr:xylulokinase [Blautia producta]MCB5877264.1 xylulokinase [Blautia producta]
MEYYCGIDLGTSSVKVMLLGADGTVVGTASAGYDIKKNTPWEAEQDMEYLWQQTRQSITALLGKYPGTGKLIRGISFSGQMHGMVAVDKNGRPVRDAVIWADQRSRDAIDHIWDAVSEEEWKKITLNTPCTGFLISSLLWMREHEPNLYGETAKVMLPKDYIRFRMCGEIATDVTDASSTGIFDVEKRQWAWELIGKLGLKREMFPFCGESYEQAGCVSSSCSRETGIAEGTPLFLGGGDSMMQLAGNGIIRPGILSCNIGTASQVACALDRPVCDTKFRTNTFCHTGSGLWEIQGSSLTGGVALKWLRDNMLHMSDFGDMTDLAGTAPAGSDGLLFLPYLSGERCPYNDPKARGIYFGMSLYHSREHLIRSTMEGVIFGLKESLEIFKGMGIRFDKVIASGGGARGQLFREIQADVFEAEIHTAGEAEQACVGAAMTAAVGCGSFSSYEEACGALLHPGTEVTVPDKERVKIYWECFARFQELYQRNKTLFS